VAAQAQPVDGVYIGAGAGANWRAQISETGANGGRLAIGSEVGFVGVGSVGFGLRAEIEGNYRSNAIGGTTVRNPNGVIIGSSSGRLSSYGGMANVLYDFNLASLGLPNVSPNIGGGIGFVGNEVSRISGRGTGAALANSLNATASGGGLAYQGIAGIAFGLGQFVPGLALTTEYRHFATTASGLRVNFNNGTTVSRTNYTPNNSDHSALIGLRYAFGVAPAPVAAALPPPPTWSSSTATVPT